MFEIIVKKVSFSKFLFFFPKEKILFLLIFLFHQNQFFGQKYFETFFKFLNTLEWPKKHHFLQMEPLFPLPSIQCYFIITVHHQRYHESSGSSLTSSASAATSNSNHHNSEVEGSGGGCSYSDDEDCNYGEYYEEDDSYYYSEEEGSGSGEPEPVKTTSKPTKEDTNDEDEDDQQNWPPWVTASPESNKDITVDEQQPRIDEKLKPREPSYSGSSPQVIMNSWLICSSTLSLFILILL